MTQTKCWFKFFLLSEILKCYRPNGALAKRRALGDILWTFPSKFLQFFLKRPNLIDPKIRDDVKKLWRQVTSAGNQAKATAIELPCHLTKTIADNLRCTFLALRFSGTENSPASHLQEQLRSNETKRLLLDCGNVTSDSSPLQRKKLLWGFHYINPFRYLPWITLDKL